MSYEVTIGQRHAPAGFGRRVRVFLAVTAGLLLRRLKPERIEAVLRRVRGSVRPSTPEEALRARADIVAASARCAYREGCLPRSVAVSILCRLEGHWASWCVGVKTQPPFGAHAWVEVREQPVGEGTPAGYFAKLIAVE